MTFYILSYPKESNIINMMINNYTSTYYKSCRHILFSNLLSIPMKINMTSRANYYFNEIIFPVIRRRKPIQGEYYEISWNFFYTTINVLEK